MSSPDVPCICVCRHAHTCTTHTFSACGLCTVGLFVFPLSHVLERHSGGNHETQRSPQASPCAHTHTHTQAFSHAHTILYLSHKSPIAFWVLRLMYLETSKFRWNSCRNLAFLVHVVMPHGCKYSLLSYQLLIVQRLSSVDKCIWQYQNLMTS